MIRIKNIYQANFLIENGCLVEKVGREGNKIFIAFVKDEFFNKYMEVWKTREH